MSGRGTGVRRLSIVTAVGRNLSSARHRTTSEDRLRAGPVLPRGESVGHRRTERASQLQQSDDAAESFIGTSVGPAPSRPGQVPIGKRPFPPRSRVARALGARTPAARHRISTRYIHLNKDDHRIGRRAEIGRTVR